MDYDRSMFKYTSEELWALQHDVTPPRPVRKAIFRHRLWLPYRQRRRARCHGITSRGWLSRTTSTPQQHPSALASCLRLPSSVGNRATRSTIAFGCLNIRSLLNKFDDVTELCRDRHIDLLCLTESWHDTDSAVLGRLRSAG